LSSFVGDGGGMIKSKKQMKRAKKGQRFKIKAEPLTEELVQYFVKYYEENGSFPGSKIPCSVTGKLTTCVGPWMRKKIKEYGSAEKLLRGYKCRGAVKVGKVVGAIVRKKKQTVGGGTVEETGEIDYKVPLYVPAPPRKFTDSELTEMSRTECFRPDIYLNNGRHCEGCPNFDLCVNNLKCLPKKSKK